MLNKVSHMILTSLISICERITIVIFLKYHINNYMCYFYMKLDWYKIIKSSC
jgi:beta-lactamase regulating signal transducer with metallopeptidase domain